MSSIRRNPLRTIFKGTPEQYAFAIQILLTCATFVAIFMFLFAMMLQSFQTFLMQFSSGNDTPVAHGMTLLWDAWPSLISILLAFFLSMFLLVIERTQRIFGPIQNMKNFLAQLEKGQFNGRLNIRKNDDFQALAQKLNSLAETLEMRNGHTRS